MISCEGAVGLLGEVLLKDQEQLHGILHPLHLLRALAAGLDPERCTVADLLALDASPLLDLSRIPVIEPDHPLSRPDLNGALAAAALMQQGQWGIMPVLDPMGQVQGVITPFTLFQIIQVADLLKLFSVAAVTLAQAPMVSGPQDPQTMGQTLVETGQRWLIVKDPADPQQARSILSDRQVLIQGWGQGSGLCPAPVVLRPSQGAAAAYGELMQQSRSALCVQTYSGPRLVTVISLLQILDSRRLFLALQEAQRQIQLKPTDLNVAPAVRYSHQDPSQDPRFSGPALPLPPLPESAEAALHPELLKRRWAEEALRKSEQLRQTMLSHVPAVIWIVDENLHYTHISGGDPLNFGLSDSLVGRHISDIDLNELLPPQQFSPAAMLPGPVPTPQPDPATSLALQANSHRQALQGHRVTYEMSARGQTYECRLDPLPDGKGVIGIAVNITDRKQAEAKMAFLAHYDPLTQLPNRVVFQNYLRLVLEQAEQKGFRVGVLFLDLDSFKTINDTLGHSVGDQLLQQVARRIQTCVRADDLIARMGGDEFTFVLAHLSSREEAVQVAQRILASLQEPMVLAHHSLHISGSIGISLYPEDGQDMDSLVRRADAAMYHAKAQGHGYIERYQPAFESNTLEWLLLECQLRQALSQEEGLTLYFQPLVDLHTGRMTAAEALLRWRTPQGDCLSPMQVVKAAEDSGLIGPLGNWVLLNACAQGQQWRDQGSSLLQLRVAVNLSFRQFIQQNLVEQITHVLDQTNLPPQCLELQLTESAAIPDPERVIQQLQHLRQMGVHLALDNFGRGHASLLYLRDLPMDQLRIDRSFLDSTQDPYQWARNQALLKAIIDMGHSLGLSIAASGVEHSEQLQVLQRLGCDQAQGHYFCPPLNIEQFGRLVADPSASQFILDGPCPL